LKAVIKSGATEDPKDYIINEAQTLLICMLADTDKWRKHIDMGRCATAYDLP
jgi:hypothetical protein